MLSVTSEHALRALTHMSRLSERQAILGRELAKRAKIPRNYLSKILWALGNAGIVDATRGSGGGYALRKRPDEIRLIEVVELFEGTRNRPACILGDKRECKDSNPCSAHAKWKDVRSALVNFLETTTIAEISPELAGPTTLTRIAKK